MLLSPHGLRLLNARSSLVSLLFFAVGCSGSGGPQGPVADPPAAAPLAGFASGSILVVSSEATAQSLAVLSLDAATGEVGLLPGSPADLGVPITDAETLAADPSQRRVFFGSNTNGRIAVFELDAMGTPVPVAGSPFSAERTGVSVIKASATGSTIYVGYHFENIISRYDVGAAGALTLAQTISTGANRHVETMILIGDVLYIGFESTSRIVGYQIDGLEAFATDAQGVPTAVADVATNQRPDFLATIGDKLYCSLAQDSSIDAFTVESDGSLTRLAGAPYAFPGIGLFELIAIQPGGNLIAVGGERPSAAMGLYAVNADGSLTPAGAPFVIHNRKGGPEGLVFSADGRFLYVCDHVGQGLYVFDVSGGFLNAAATPRYALPGRQIDVIRLDLAVSP